VLLVIIMLHYTGSFTGRSTLWAYDDVDPGTHCHVRWWYML